MNQGEMGQGGGHGKHWRILLTAVSLLLISTPVLAHKVNIFAFAEKGKVLVDGYFADGTKAMDSKVKIFDPDGKLLLEAATDNQGHFEFPVPGQFDVKIVVDAGMGHRAEWVLPASELGGVSGAVAEKQAAVAGNKNDAVQSTMAAGQLDNAAIRQAVDEAVAEAIKPLVRTLEESQQHASITQIIGSIGYIFGVLGLWAYFKSRPGNAKKDKP